MVDAIGSSPNSEAATRWAALRTATLQSALSQVLHAMPHALLLVASFLMVGLADWLADTGDTGYLTVLRLEAARVPNLLLWFGAWCLLSRKRGLKAPLTPAAS